MEVARNPEIMKTLFTLIRIFVGWHSLYEGVAKLRSSPPFFHYSAFSPSAFWALPAKCET